MCQLASLANSLAFLLSINSCYLACLREGMVTCKDSIAFDHIGLKVTAPRLQVTLCESHSMARSCLLQLSKSCAGHSVSISLDLRFSRSTS